MKGHRILFLVLLALAGTANAQKPRIQWDPEFAFDSISTFGWQSTPETSLEQSNPFMHSLVMTALEYQLASAGLTKVEAGPDIWVTYHTETEDRVRLRSNSYGYGFGGYGMGGWGAWGYGFGGPIGTTTTTDVIEYEEDTLIVDLWDPATQELVFRGEVTRVFSQTPQKAEKQLQKAIEKMAKRAEKLMTRAQR